MCNEQKAGEKNLSGHSVILFRFAGRCYLFAQAADSTPAM